MEQRLLNIGRSQSQCVFTAEENTQGHVLIRIDDDAETAVIELNARAYASWDITVLVPAGTAELSIDQRHTIEGGASLRLHIVTLRSRVTHSLVSHVTGPDAESSINWMFYAKDGERQNLHVRNVFDATGGRGEILQRGIAEGTGHAECRGLIDIGLYGGGTNTYLTQEVLMLDPTSKVDAIPGLEIKTNDVKASHSATVARITEEDLFYFGARGIDPHEARRMFVLGFLGDLTDKIPDNALRTDIIGLIEAKYATAVA